MDFVLSGLGCWIECGESWVCGGMCKLLTKIAREKNLGWINTTIVNNNISQKFFGFHNFLQFLWLAVHPIYIGAWWVITHDQELQCEIVHLIARFLINIDYHTNVSWVVNWYKIMRDLDIRIEICLAHLRFWIMKIQTT